jgi:choline dehydrogenase-like flavoprotein
MIGDGNSAARPASNQSVANGLLTPPSGDGAPVGFASHQTGTAGMGTDPRASVLNPTARHTM